MSNTQRHHTSKVDRYGRRQPRPNLRRTNTRSAVVLAALKEG
jgi:hypothetical protein